MRMRWAQCEIPALSRVNMPALGGSYTRRWLLLSMFVLALMLPASSGCPKSCACYVPGEVHCTFRYLTAIPEQIQASVERINMGYNRITVLREGDFTGLLNLELLMLHSNTIHSIENSAFLDLKSLQVLKMSYNKVKELKKETFKGLDSLLRLHMDHNSIEFISPDAFFGLTSLQLVHLEGNLLHQLHPDTFVTLRLSGAFKVSSVRNIHLSDNHLTGLPADIFSGCSRLENLFLHGNPWSCDCRMEWLPKWSQRNPGVLKCKRDKKYAQGQLCPMCASPGPHPGRSLSQLPSESFTCTQPWIHPHLKQSNVSLATGDFTPVLPRDFIAPIGSIKLNLTDHFFNVAVLSCTVQRPSSMENLTLTEEDDDVSLLRVDVASSLVCSVDYEHVQQLWHILATYSDSPMRLERGLMLSRSPEMLYQYRQLRPEEGQEGIYTDVKAVITASPGWLMQEMVHLQLDRTTTTYSTLHIRYWSVVQLRVESRVPKKDRYSWTLIKRDNKTRTEHTVLKGGVAELNCQTMGEPKPSVEWILADGNKVRAPFFSEEGKIVITADGRLTLRGADISDAGLYRCIATNYLDADILNFRITVLPTDVEEAEVNGVQLSRAPGQDLVLDCGSTGSPEASVQWILPDHSVVRESYGNKKLHENGTLRIRGLTARDRGFYRCLAANYMGADLLVSLVTLTAEAAGAVAEDEEPTLGVDVMVESDTGEKEMDLSEPPPLSERTSQESRTITSDRPYPRLGSLGRGRMGQRRNGAMGNRRIWSNRIFNANSRRVAPEKFAEFMKKAQEPNVTPMTDGAGPANPVVHTSTDAESQTTFTAVTITERGQDEVTFHTTQKITSPGLPAGSTIISHQQIHIIPPPKTGRGGGRGGGRRRPFQGRRRIIKPNRITDIQSYINKLTLPTIKKERNVTVGYTVQRVTDLSRDAKEKTTTTEIPNVAISPISMGSHWSKSDIPLSAQHTTATTKYHTTKAVLSNSQSGPGYSRDYITSADAPERTFTPDPLISTSEEAISSTTPMPTKAAQKRFQWHRQFGHKGKYRQRLNRFQRPSIKTQTTTTVKTTTMIPTTTPAAPATTMYLIHSRYTTSKESSSDNGYQDVSSADYEPTTASPISHYQTSTIPTFNTFTNTQTSPPIQTIDSPPTVSPPSRANPDESSGSGGYPEDWRVIKQKPKGAGGHIGRRRKPIKGRRPFRKPTTTTAAPTTTQATTNLKPTIYTTMRTLMKTTIFPFSVSTPLYTSSREYDGSTGMASSEEQTNVYGEDKWHDSTYTTPQTKTMTKGPWAIIPKPSSTVITIRTTKNPATTFRTTVYSNIKPAKGNGYQPTAMPIRPTMRSNSGIPVDFDTFALTTPEQEYPTTATTVVVDLTTAKNMQSKPKILGGNAASFTVLSNSDAFLPCEAVGDPEPAIRWMRFSTSTGHTITIKGKMGKFEVLSNGTLAIQNANIKDRGQYLCLAENDLGSDKLLVTLSVVAYPSRILEPKIREIKSHAGSTVEMKCKAEGRPTPLISWILANRTQVRGYISGKGRASVTPEGTLIIEQVSVYDRGHYKCIASNPAGAATATVRLQVVSAPPGILQEKRENVKAVMGQSLWLPCTGQGNPPPTLHWVQPDGSAVQTNRPAPDPRVAMYDNGTLHFKDLALTDNGKYECIATSSTGSERRVVTVTVEKRDSAPRIEETSQLVTEMSFGDQLRLNCMATGEPKPRIMWRLPSKAVVDQWHRMGSRIHVEENGTLIVNMVNDKDAGDYLCVARSKMGDEFRLMKVTVSMQPAKIEPKHYGKKQVPFGRDLKVDCKASGSPQPDISWGLPDGTLVNSAMQSDSSSGNNGGRRTRRFVLFDNGTLYLNQVGISEEGDYTCYAENQVGKDEMHVHITVVTAAPRIRPPRLTYGKVKPGGNVRFDCEAVGEPKPKILWMLPNNDVIAASHERYLMHVNGSLDIRDVKMMDVGQYVCMARNPAGENRKVYRLELDGNPPVINGYRQNRTVIKDAAVKYSRKFIDCKAEGTPSPSITWIMPDNIFLKAPYFGSRINVHHNGTLEFRNVRPTDTAEYICMARNGEGEAVMVVQLEVTSMLRRPIFRNPFNERVVTRLGKTAVLNCSADGYPTPEMIWILPNGTRITAGPERGYRHPLGSDGTFMIYNSVKEDSGKYRCAAKNTVGYIEKLILLEVGQKPYILSRPRGIIRAVSGEPLFVHCLVDSSPRPIVSWTVPGGHTLTGTQALGRYRLLENGTLVVRDTTIYDRGTYVCRAQNDAGEAVLKVPVIIIAYTPRITTWPPPNVRAMVGAPVQLSCGAIGIPKPEINWELPDGSVLSAAGPGRHKGSELLHPQGTLIIQRPMVSDSGAYKCIAKNPLGTDTKVTYVRVL
ncbi:unnamed protein product [Boreogadus saida]